VTVSTETEIRHYNRAGKVVPLRSPDGVYVLKVVWHGHTVEGVTYRRSEKSGWLKAAPANKVKFKTWAEQRDWAEKVRNQR
jgi:hypothetical protein